jgi:glyoxylase-like metal-dependent hydrolase (beta-lactamase superfamily II)
MLTMKSFLSALVAVVVTSTVSAAWSDPLDMHWNEGAKDCKANPQPTLEVHAYDSQTFVLRENLCATFEAPFMYLLIGSRRALLIDDGDVADPKLVPLADTVLHLLPMNGLSRLPLLVVHTHRYLDHRAGDAQFAGRHGVQVVGYDIDSVKRYYGFARWPDGVAQTDLGGRTIDVIPTPGHEATHVAFYDRNTGLFFSGDFMMPARLLIDDGAADLASAKRVATFVANRPVRYVLGGHIEEDANGKLFEWESQYHPNERVLPMSKSDLLALPAALEGFNGFYSDNGQFVMIDSMRMLIAMATGVLAILAALVFALVAFIRRRRRARRT